MLIVLPVLSVAKFWLICAPTFIISSHPNEVESVITVYSVVGTMLSYSSHAVRIVINLFSTMNAPKRRVKHGTLDTFAARNVIDRWADVST